MTVVGLSSTSFPRRTPNELMASGVLRAGDCVDLRFGVQHRWEDSGLRESVASLRVIFVSVPVTLGSPVAVEHREAIIDAAQCDVPVKIRLPKFSGPASVGEVGSALRALAESCRIEVRFVVETHEPAWPPPLLAEIASAHGLGVVVDNLGLARCEWDLDATERVLGEHWFATQIKGFSLDGDTWSHAPLRHSRNVVDWIRRYRPLLCERFATIETKAGSGIDDLSDIRVLLGG